MQRSLSLVMATRFVHAAKLGKFFFVTFDADGGCAPTRCVAWAWRRWVGSRERRRGERSDRTSRTVSRSVALPRFKMSDAICRSFICHSAVLIR